MCVVFGDSFGQSCTLHLLPLSQHFLHLSCFLVHQLTFWRFPSYPDHPVDIQVPFVHLQNIKVFLESYQMKYFVLIEDVQVGNKRGFQGVCYQIFSCLGGVIWQVPYTSHMAARQRRVKRGTLGGSFPPITADFSKLETQHCLEV